MDLKLSRVFGPQSLLASIFPRYEHRPGQLRMARLVRQALSDDEVVLVEAPTGTGKTLAYLIPAVLTDRRVVISTGTKALQEQIINKDIPVVEQLLGTTIKAVLMKGRQNYLCRYRWRNFLAQPTFEMKGETALLPIITRWAATTETGDRAEIVDLPDDAAVWRDICATRDSCPGGQCQHHSTCFLTRLRARAAAADLVVANHHLLFADLSVRLATNGQGQVMPEYDAIICDEAHQIESTATSFFGQVTSVYRFLDWERDLLRALGARKIADDVAPRTLTAMARTRDAIFAHFRDLPGTQQRLAAGNVDSKLETLLLHLHDEAGYLAGHLEKTATDKSAPDVAVLAARLRELVNITDDICAADDARFVYWRETKPRAVILHKDPIDLAQAMQDSLFAHTRAVVFTSATLTTNGGFDFIKARLGVNFEVLEESLPTCFDYQNQGVFYLPQDTPDPRDPSFLADIFPRIEALVRGAGGRSLCLFTSIANMRAAHEALSAVLPFPCLLQGEAPKHQLLSRKRNEPETVLFATASFWEGVDIAGDALRCVIIDKLPFASPSEPLVAARIEKIDNDGGRAFVDYQLPAAIIMLKQGLGRLIRTADDFGVLALMDSRVHTKGYGRRILDSLPEFRKTSRLPDVVRYLESLASDRQPT